MASGDTWRFGARVSACTGRMRVKELAGKTVFVTGAASGIGLGIATAFAQAGAKVMLCDIEEAALSAAQPHYFLLERPGAIDRVPERIARSERLLLSQCARCRDRQ
jgi:NAD(P)-dependent dehydrogenase (short-subunit alcohol dehydrogenase family)